MKKIVILVLALMFLGAACNRNGDTQRNPHYADGHVKIAGREISMEIAKTPERQAKGLGDRESIEENQGMLFQFEAPILPSFWMKDMKFAIDIVWIKGDEVVDVTPDIPNEPGVPDERLKTYSPKVPADRVLELKAGWASRNGLMVGDKVEFMQVVQ